MTIPHTATATLWRHPRAFPTLDAGVVHVWRTFVPWLSGRLQELRSLLSPEETERLHAYRFDADRTLFLAERAMLRSLLSAYVDIDPKLLVFSEGQHGKPALSGPSTVQFSVSHSSGCALVAVSCDAEVGVDVEGLRTELDWRAIAQNFYTPRERQLLEKLDGEAEFVGFYRIWTLKESYLKLSGEGMTRPLDSFETATSPTELTPGAGFVRWMPREVTFRILEAGPDHAAAIAIAGSPSRCCAYDWKPDMERIHT